MMVSVWGGPCMMKEWGPRPVKCLIQIYWRPVDPNFVNIGTTETAAKQSKPKFSGECPNEDMMFEIETSLPVVFQISEL